MLETVFVSTVMTMLMLVIFGPMALIVVGAARRW